MSNNNQETISILKRPINYIGDGNVVESPDFFSEVLVNEQQQELTREFPHIKHLYDDYYIVGNAVQTIDRDKLDPELIVKVLYGVIRLSRDNNDKVIPYNEKIVVPFHYDRITIANSDTVIGTITGYPCYGYPKHTYIELNPTSKNYGKQLLPIVFNALDLFDREYEGFARCRIHDDERYMPRNCEPTDQISADDLLDKSEMDSLFNAAPKAKMKKLTGGCMKSQVSKK